MKNFVKNYFKSKKDHGFFFLDSLSSKILRVFKEFLVFCSKAN